MVAVQHHQQGGVGAGTADAAGLGATVHQHAEAALVDVVPVLLAHHPAVRTQSGDVADAEILVIVAGQALKTQDQFFVVILHGSTNVPIGGGTTTLLPIQSEVPEWVRWAAVVASILRRAAVPAVFVPPGWEFEGVGWVWVPAHWQTGR